MIFTGKDLITKIAFSVAGLIGGIILTIMVITWLDTGLLFSSVLFLLLVFIFVITIMVSKSMAMRKNTEADHLEKLVEMKREVDKTARRYRSLLEGAGNAIFVFDADDGSLREVNRKGTELLGYTKEEMVRLTGKELTPEQEQARFTSLVLRVKRRGRARVDCLTFRRKNGEHILGEVEARFIDLGDERVVHATIRNITYRKRVEKEIRQRNRELSILNRIIAKANESLQLKNVLDVILQEVMEVFAADGGSIHLLDTDGRVLSLAANINLSSAFIAETRESPCAAAEANSCHALAAPPKPICKMTCSAMANGWNSVVGVPLFAKKRLIGIMHIMSGEARPYSQDEIKFFTTIGNQIGIVIEHAQVFAEVSWKTDELLRSHSLLEKSSRQLTLSQNRLRKNLALVERANLELESLDRMKNHFLGIISHEFRTPLTSILGGVEYLLATCPDKSGEQRRMLEIILQGGTRLNQIVNDLLKIARLEAKTTIVQKSALRLDEILLFLREQFASLLQERQQEIILEDMASLPYFTGNREYLEEVFLQLLENAIKFTQDGGKIIISARLTDRITLTEKNNLLLQFNPTFYEQMGDEWYFQVEVRDSGIGIDAEEQQRIFDKFYSIGETRHHYSSNYKFQGKGPGLGLAIVKGMVEAHGGMVWVESPQQDLDRQPGSSFFILLPVEENQEQPALPFIQKSDSGPQLDLSL